MGLGGAGRVFRLYLWYLDFSMLSALSYAFFYAYLVSYDRFALGVSAVGAGFEGFWMFLFGEASSLYEVFLFYVCAAAAASVLFGRELAEGFSYVRYLAGVGRVVDFCLKWLAYLVLVVAPLLGAKALLVVVWGWPLLAVDSLGFLWALTLYGAGLAAAASYVFPFFALLSLALRRPSHVVLAVTSYLYLFDNAFVRGALMNPLSLTRAYMLMVPLRPGFYASLPVVGVAVSAAAAAAALIFYAGWGEVKWP